MKLLLDEKHLEKHRITLVVLDSKDSRYGSLVKFVPLIESKKLIQDIYCQV